MKRHLSWRLSLCLVAWEALIHDYRILCSWLKSPATSSHQDPGPVNDIRPVDPSGAVEVSQYIADLVVSWGYQPVYCDSTRRHPIQLSPPPPPLLHPLSHPY
jgi:hypothetical protein